jgi:hypothetical protein
MVRASLLYVEKVLAPTLKPDNIVIMDMCGRPRWCKPSAPVQRALSP